MGKGGERSDLLGGDLSHRAVAVLVNRCVLHVAYVGVRPAMRDRIAATICGPRRDAKQSRYVLAPALAPFGASTCMAEVIPGELDPGSTTIRPALGAGLRREWNGVGVGPAMRSELAPFRLTPSDYATAVSSLRARSSSNCIGL